MHMSAQKINAKPSVFEYEDYRSFLRDLYLYLKMEYRYFSYRYFSKRAGFSSPNFLKLVIDGKRNLSPESVIRFVSALKLSKAESDFFSNLVRFNQAASPTEKSLAAQKMLRSQNFQNIHPLTKAQFSYYSEWYYIPVRELVALETFKEDIDWICQKIFPAIEPKQASKALLDLEALGLIQRDASGRLRQVNLNLNTDNEVVSSSMAKYHREMMKLASESIDRVPRGKREISAVCVPVSEATVIEIKSRIQTFRKELLSLASQDLESDRVYQINLQLFPLTSWSGE